MNERELAMVARKARERGIEPAALAAVVSVESGGTIAVRIGPRLEPLIRFEGHVFDRLLDDAGRIRARAAGLASPSAGAIRNPPAQPARWALVRRAAAIDETAAYEATSWGIGQVMGMHWRMLGYSSVAALVAEARSGFEGQLELMLRYIDKTGLAPALAARDWHAFARGYNGPAYARHGYHEKLASAYERHATRKPAMGPQPVVLRQGDRGDDVVQLQSRLNSCGHKLAVDGIFGPLTAAALRAFQSESGISVDGVAGPESWRALYSRKREPRLFKRLKDFLFAIFR